MKRYLISVGLLLTNLVQVLAYDRYGRDYSVNGGGNTLTMLFAIAFVGLIIYVWISSMFNNKNKK